MERVSPGGDGDRAGVVRLADAEAEGGLEGEDEADGEGDGDGDGEGEGSGRGEGCFPADAADVVGAAG